MNDGTIEGTTDDTGDGMAPSPRRVERCWLSEDAEATEALGEALGRTLGPGAVVALNGELGAGKTTLVRGLARGLGIEEGIASPTYTLMQAHEGGRLPLYHFDAWLEGREKALFLDGGDEWLRAGGVAVVEWAERVAPWLPLPRLEVRLEHRSPTRRRVCLACVGEGPGGPLEALLEALEAPLGLVPDEDGGGRARIGHDRG